MTPFSLSDDRPSRWETEVLLESRALVHNRAAGIGRLQILDMEEEDARQKMFGEVIAVCRRWAEKSPDKPPPQLVNGAIRNVTRNLYRTIGRSKRDVRAEVKDSDRRRSGNTAGWATIPKTEPDAGDRLDKAERHKLHVELVAQVRAAVNEDQFTLLQLYGAEAKPREIAAALGDGRTNTQIGRAVYKARQRAGDVLRSLGIEGAADIERLLESPE